MNAAAAWTLDRDASGLAWLTLDRPGGSANVLSREVLLELGDVVAGLEARPPRGLVLRSGKPGGFIAGADIRDFTRIDDPTVAYEWVRAAQRVLDRIEALPCPSVAAIEGFALGGGLELALACHYRVAVANERLTLGLPEVQLGIHPGFGGTVRSVRLLGARTALDLMLTGRSVRSDRAAQIGLVDRLVDDRDALDAAARDLCEHAPPRRRPGLPDRALSWPALRPLLRPRLLAGVRARVRREHYPAPYAIVELWARHGARGEAAFDAEARSIADLFVTPTSRNLVRLFLLQDRLKAQAPGAADDLRRVHVVGAGVMGGDIAAWCALRGFDVTLQDQSAERIAPALQRASELFGKRVRDPAARAQAAARLRADVSGAGVADADVVVEAIFENLDAKRALYARLEQSMRPDALLATNTSSLQIEALAEGLGDPGRLVGLHFFNPVAQMPLVEIVRGAATRADAERRAIAFTRRLDKLPLPCRSAPGFLVNRVLVPYLHEAMHAAAEGLALETIDRAAVDAGMPMGPVELADVVGLDVCLHVGDIVASALGRTPPDLARLRALVAAGHLGRKTGRGLYEWREGKPRRGPEPAGAAPPDLADRLLLALANEAVAALREGIVADADLVDAGMVFGAGYAPFRGGPLQDARQRGTGNVVAQLNALAERYGARFAPDAGWSSLG
jgi:3-hydroxyacyl-CoA dehydrogenase/enoyl-CoA hydratase/3-hydroxybutyryl-CoA epimerase